MEVLIYSYGALYAVALPQLLIRRIQDDIWRRVLLHNGIPKTELKRDLTHLAAIRGCVERTLYVASILAGFPEFVGVWLAVKVAGNWKGWSDTRKYQWDVGAAKGTGEVPGAQVFNAHLIGVALSLLFAAAGAYSIRWLLDSRAALAFAIGALVVGANGILLVWARRHE